MAGREQRDRLVALLAPVVRSAGLDLEDLTVTPAGRRSVLRVVVDADGGVSLDDVAEVSQAVSTALDGADVLGDRPYTLEVTSPGVDRPLTEPRHWRRAVGRLVRVSVGGEVSHGRVLSADDSGAVLEVAGGSRGYRYDELGPGRVQIEWDRPVPGTDGAGAGEVDEVLETPDPPRSRQRSTAEDSAD